MNELELQAFWDFVREESMKSWQAAIEQEFEEGNNWLLTDDGQCSNM